MYEQLNIFDMTLPQFKIDKPIRLVELFAGVGSQAMALRDLGADFEHYRISEWEVNANRSYKAIHMPDDNIDYSSRFGTFKWVARVLYEYGISVDGKTRLTLKEIRKRGEKWVRQTYNEFRATHNTGSITSTHALDLKTIHTDRYCYIMTYSFPCQDLSVAGMQKGMEKGSGTRSGLLWEVERLLNECAELPQVLIMENVPQVHSRANMKDFQKWIDFLKSKGYSNYWQDLNAKDYGVAQNRVRTYMVSILGDWNYKFPKPIPLKKTMKDYLEDEVDEKYYIETEKSRKLIEKLISNGTVDGCIGNVNPSGKGINGNVYAGKTAPTLTTNKGEGAKICVDLSVSGAAGIKTVSNCITARENRSISNRTQVGNGVVEWKEEKLGNIYGFDGGNYAGNVYNKEKMSPTIRTFQGENQQPMIIDNTYGFKEKPRFYKNTSPRLRSERGGLKTIVAMRGRNPDNPSDRTAGSPTEQRLEPNSQGICNTLTSVQKDNLVMESIPVSYGLRIPCRKIDVGMCLMARYHKGFSNYNPENAVISNYRIRKLTPLECWRLMDFLDEDFYRAAGVNSNSQLYKQEGNSIVRNVLMAVMGQLIPGKEYIYRGDIILYVCSS